MAEEVVTDSEMMLLQHKKYTTQKYNTKIQHKKYNTKLTTQKITTRKN